MCESASMVMELAIAMARNPLSPAQRRADIATAEDDARQATEIVLNAALDLLHEQLDLRNHRSQISEPMTKMIEKTARKVLKARFKVETRGRKRTYRLGFFREKNVLDRGAQLAREDIGAGKAAEIIHAELKAEYRATRAIIKQLGLKIEQGIVPTASAIKGRLERSRR
jgi:hypothetical protein